MWNSLPFVQAVASWAFIIGIIAGAVALAAGAVTTVASNRAAELSEKARKDEARAADLKIAEANARAEQARLETERLRGSVADRDLTEEQIRSLQEALKGAPEFEIWLAFNEEDAEATSFRHQLDRAFRSSGVETKYFSGLNPAVVGLNLSGPEGPEKELVVTALERAGLRVRRIQELRWPKDLALFIGGKPGVSGRSYMSQGDKRQASSG